VSLVYVIAGEASGDLLGARLIAALRASRPDLTFAGIGGPAMAAQGVTSLFPMHELALMGLVEVLPKLRQIRARLDQTVADITARRPAVVVTIDSPGFTLRVLRRIVPLGIKRVHYVAPQAWAWRESRVKKFPGLWDKLLCLLPFEPEFFARHHLHAEFTGHPVLESGADHGDADRFRARHHVPPDARLLITMPGSRRSEIARHLPTMRDAIRMIAAQVPNLHPVVPTTPHLVETLTQATATWPQRPILVTDEVAKFDAFAAATAALSKSGTSTLELALAGVPMIVTYRVNPITAAIARRVIKVQFASILNLLAGRAVLPEFIQQDFTTTKLVAGLLPLLTDPAAAQAQRDAARPYLDMLRAPAGQPPSVAAADAVLALLQ